VIRRQIVKRDVFCPDETQLLEIGVSKAPPTPLVRPDSVRKHPREALLGVDLGNTLALGIDHPLLASLAIGCGKSKCGLHAPTEFVVAQPGRSGIANGRENCPTEQGSE